MTYHDDLPTRDDRDCDNCRHRSPEHCPCKTVEVIELTDGEFSRIVDSLGGEDSWPPRSH